MRNFSGVLSSMYYALSGIFTTIKQERNFRIHLVAAAYVLFFQQYYLLEPSEKAILVLTIALVLATELINTAIEKVIDLQISQYHKLAKLSKDAAAGAVLVMAAAGLIVGFLLFWDLQVLSFIVWDILHHIWKMTAFLLSIGLGCWFVFCFGDKQDSRCPPAV